jgi:hypothetical protein
VRLLFCHVHLPGGPAAPVRRFLPELIDRIWNRTINPGKVFDLELPLDQVVEPGTIELHAGSSSTDIRSTVTLELQGPARTVRGKRQLVTSTRVLRWAGTWRLAQSQTLRDAYCICH